MEDIRSILNHHLPKKHVDKSRPNKSPKPKKASMSEIPDLFFDDILVKFRITRIEIMVLMYLYRIVWCRPNLHKDYGIGPIISYADLAQGLEVTLDELHTALRKLEAMEFIETVRSGQYFVRKYFTKENDEVYGQRYDDFL